MILVIRSITDDKGHSLRWCCAVANFQLSRIWFSKWKAEWPLDVTAVVSIEAITFDEIGLRPMKWIEMHQRTWPWREGPNSPKSFHLLRFGCNCHCDMKFRCIESRWGDQNDAARPIKSRRSDRNLLRLLFHPKIVCLTMSLCERNTRLEIMKTFLEGNAQKAA